ncbi:MAG: hypothetical protein ABUL73_01585 [Alphaproteobacteria bacterium]
MSEARFSAGQRVSVVRKGLTSPPTGAYRIVSVLPLESGQRQYRVRNDAEAFDRILDEGRLQVAELV